MGFQHFNHAEHRQRIVEVLEAMLIVAKSDNYRGGEINWSIEDDFFGIETAQEEFYIQRPQKEKIMVSLDYIRSQNFTWHEEPKQNIGDSRKPLLE